MPRVLVSDQVSDRGLEILKSAPGLEVVYKPGLKEAELQAEIPGFDALVIRSGSKVTAKVLATNVFERAGTQWWMVLHHGSPVMGPPADEPPVQ